MKKICFVIMIAVACFSLVQAKGKRVLFIGDSITDGNWGGGGAKPSSQRNQWDMNHIYGSGFMYLSAAYYQGKYPQKEYEFFNRGISGNALQYLSKRWNEDVIRMHPDVLSVLIGTNDVGNYMKSDKSVKFDFTAWEKLYRQLLDEALQANPNLKIVLCSPFVANTGNLKKTGNYEERDSMVRHCTIIVKRIARDYRATYIPFDEVVDNLLKKCPTSKETYWIWDGVHPTPAAHQRLAELWISKTKGIMK